MSKLGLIFAISVAAACSVLAAWHLGLIWGAVAYTVSGALALLTTGLVRAAEYDAVYGLSSTEPGPIELGSVELGPIEMMSVSGAAKHHGNRAAHSL